MGLWIEDRKSYFEARLPRIIRADFKNKVGVGGRRRQFVFSPALYIRIKLVISKIGRMKLTRNGPVVIAAVRNENSLRGPESVQESEPKLRLLAAPSALIRTGSLSKESKRKLLVARALT
jgi:hypothetical protein